MTISNNATEQIRNRETKQAVLMLVTIYEGTPLRLVNNLVDVVSRGNTFTAFPLSINVSADDGETLQTVNLVLDNVSLEMVDWIRTITSPVSVTIETIFSGDLNTVEQSISDLVIREISYNANTIIATLMADDDLNQKIPSDTFNSLDFPGLF